MGRLFCLGVNIIPAKNNCIDIEREIMSHGFKCTGDIAKEYISSKSKLSIECSKGHRLFISYNALAKKYSCPHCNKHQYKYTLEEVKQEFLKNNCILLSTEYLNNKQKLDYKCSCGNRSSITFDSFKRGHRCRSCSGSKKYTYEEIKNIFEKNNCELISTKYINNKSKLEYICACGHPSTIQLSNFLNGVRCMNCYRENNTGQNHPAWNFNLKDEERIKKRKFYGYAEWRNSIFERDKFTCQCCGDNKGGNLNAHHLNGWNWAIDERLNIDNGITLCDKCHDDFHLIYGYGDNTKEQFSEWISEIYNQILGSEKYKYDDSYNSCTN